MWEIALLNPVRIDAPAGNHSNASLCILYHCDKLRHPPSAELGITGYYEMGRLPQQVVNRYLLPYNWMPGLFSVTNDAGSVQKG